MLAETAVTVAGIYAVWWWIVRPRYWATRNAARRKPAGEEKLALCSFCGKNQDQVRKLIAGPKVHICDECIDLCNDIIAEECDQEQRLASRSQSRAPVVPSWVGATGLVLVLVAILVAVFCFAQRP